MQLTLGPNTMIHHHDKREWDDLACRDSLNTLLNTNNPWNHCQLLTAQVSHSAAWSEAFPIANVGNLLSPDELCIAIALRTGVKIFESAKCRCDKIVDELGNHGLSCTKMQAASKTFSHQLLPQRVVDPHLPSTLEPGCLRNDGRKPDGLTWASGTEA